jgi:hypothetical protein
LKAVRNNQAALSTMGPKLGVNICKLSRHHKTPLASLCT